MGSRSRPPTMDEQGEVPARIEALRSCLDALPLKAVTEINKSVYQHATKSRTERTRAPRKSNTPFAREISTAHSRSISQPQAGLRSSLLFY
ncbi:hypothetical protein N9192_02155 [Akkermansiaceae bacterium]|nr:hypothetical protein [Akkermansiaceae bacterium]